MKRAKDMQELERKHAAKPKAVPPRVTERPLPPEYDRQALYPNILDELRPKAKTFASTHTPRSVEDLHERLKDTSKFTMHNMKVEWAPERVTRQQRSVIRRFVRDSRARNGRRLRDLRHIQRLNSRKLAEDGVEALLFYLQDEGAGVISVHQILSMHRDRKLASHGSDSNPVAPFASIVHNP